MAIFSSFLSGLAFGIGLLVSEMANPAKVIGFLDLAGTWDPSLVLVMAAALIPGAVAYLLARQRKSSLLGNPMQIPVMTQIDGRLTIGSGTFGIGWGLAGICPGSALVLVGTGLLQGIVFVASLLLGMGLFEFLERFRQ